MPPKSYYIFIITCFSPFVNRLVNQIVNFYRNTSITVLIANSFVNILQYMSAKSILLTTPFMFVTASYHIRQKDLNIPLYPLLSNLWEEMSWEWIKGKCLCYQVIMQMISTLTEWIGVDYIRERLGVKCRKLSLIIQNRRDFNVYLSQLLTKRKIWQLLTSAPFPDGRLCRIIDKVGSR